MKHLLSFIVLSCFFFSYILSFSQKRIPDKLIFEGVVSGYYLNTDNSSNKKDRQIKLEGVLEGVNLRVLEGDVVVAAVKTNKKGIFKLILDIGHAYRLELCKTGYSTNNLLIDLKSVSNELKLKGLIIENMELLLNSFISDNELITNKPFGKLYYDVESKSFAFQELNIKIRKGLFSKEKIDNPSVSLILKALLKNKNNLKDESYTENKTSLLDSNTNKQHKQSGINKFNLKTKKIENFTSEEISLREAEINLAREQIEKDKLNAKTPQDSLLIQQRESILQSAENELETAKKYIEAQDKVISTQHWLLILLTGFLLLILILLFVIYKNHEQRKAANLLLEQKNNNITASINYAQRIQQSILLNETDIKRIVPNSFVFYQPRDIVSGDFYMFSEVNKKIIVAAVDCTGHGVPGAFMSFIGYSLLNEIINEKEITKPSEILKKLHSGIVSLLRQNTDDLSSQDGMELSLCVFDKKTKKLEYAGAMNPVYIVTNNKIQTLEPDNYAIGGIEIVPKNTEISFTDKQVQLSENDFVYLFSDGFADQFGGEKNVKFNISRFKNLLLEIYNKKPEEQKEILEKTINSWKSHYRQIDDMLIIGVKF